LIHSHLQAYSNEHNDTSSTPKFQCCGALAVFFPQTVEAAVEDIGEDHEENCQNGNEAAPEC